MVNGWGPLLPYSSLKPFIGTRDVPVTNCSTRERISGLKDRTTCSTAKHLVTADQNRVGHLSIYPPEPLDDDVVCVVVALVVGVLFPIADVDGSDTAHEKLELVFVEYFQHRQGDQIFEAIQKGAHLSLDSRNESPLNHQTEADQKKKKRKRKMPRFQS